MSAQEHAVYRFAGCELDVRERRLHVHGQPVTLTPKVFDTLVLLVERAGHVVSKDELMAALWPRGFVHESNLTKHIWLIRHALGEGEDDGRCIETVPKLGYRFVAPVQRVACAEPVTGDPAWAGSGIRPLPDASVAPRGTPIDVPEAPTRREWLAGRDPERRNGETSHATYGQASAANTPHGVPTIRLRDRVRLTAIGLIMIALVGAWYWWRITATVPVPASSPDAGAVAIVDFNNLSGNAKDAWLGPALEQMLATEVAVSGKLHAVPEELVRPARADLPAPDAGGYAPASLATLQHRLGARYVLSGAYLVSGTSDAPQLRVDLTVQDSHTGTMFASLSRSAAVNDLPQLVAQVGGELRKRFGEPVSGPEALKRIASAQPPTSETARHVGFALQALSQNDPARARDELLQAIAQSSGYAPAYLNLAHAWSMLGYRAKAIAAAEQAAQNAGGLPDEQQLQIRAEQAALGGNKAQASAIWGKLVAMRPEDPEYRLHRIAALTAVAEYGDAQAALAQAAKLPGLAGDPRIELAAVNLEAARGNAKVATSHARAALASARRRGDNGLVAEAELQLGIALDQDRQAEPMLRAAAADFHRIANPHGEALAWQNLGNLEDGRVQVGQARENYQRAMTIYQGIGDLGGEAAIYDDLSRMLWAAGDRDGTEAALRQALRIGRETNDPARQAWSLTGLATVLSDESAGDDVAAMYREAIALDRQSNARPHLVFALSTYADLLRVSGQLDEARDTCVQAQDIAATFPVASRGVSADFECAQIALDRGDTAIARAALAAIEKTAVASKDGFSAANAQFVLGQIAMGRRQWNDAYDLLQHSLAGWTAQQEKPGMATTSALLALCAEARGDVAMRDRFYVQARDLRAGINQRQEVFPLDVSLTELRGYTDKSAADGLAALRELADDAVKRQWIGLAFEARLAQLRVLEHGVDRAAAKAARDALAADARRDGFGWVSQRLALARDASNSTQR